jgi:hypothetical protein
MTIFTRRFHPAALALAALMTATRYAHAGVVLPWPDASMAVFFLGGWAGLQSRSFLGFLGLAVLIDVLAIYAGGVPASCLSPAYIFLVPAYALLWRMGQGARGEAWGKAGTSLLAASAGGFLISNASFYFFSGHFGSVSMKGFLAQAWTFGPSYVGACAAYGVAGMALGALWSARKTASAPVAAR